MGVVDGQQLPAFFIKLSVDVEQLMRLDIITQRALLTVGSAVELKHLIICPGQDATALQRHFSPGMSDHLLSVTLLQPEQTSPLGH
jgi:hypothetical protein